MPEDENEAEADAAAPQEEAVGRSFMVFEEKIDESKDMRPLNQLKLLSERHKNSHPMDMFHQNHMEQLRKYVDKSEEFTGEVCFYESQAFVLKPDNYITTEGNCYMNIKTINLASQLDLLPSDIDDEQREGSQIKKAGELKYFSVESLSSQNLSPGSPSKYKKAVINMDAPALAKNFLDKMSHAESSRKVELIQNGRFVYFWSATL
jgi:hypothetical protein